MRELDLYNPATRANTAALIPAYFEAAHIGEVVRRVARELDLVLVVDDGSSDSTAEIARTAGAEVIRHELNRGKGAAIKTGLGALQQREQIEYVALLDGDGQHVPEEIPAFLETANATRAPLVLGNRMTDLEEMPLVRKMTNRYMSWQISQLCGQPIPDSQCGFRLLRADLLPALTAAASNNYDFETEMLVIASRAGHRIAPVPVSTVYGDEKSKIRPVRDTIRFFQLLRRLSC
jgi:glycosyltransferase involved in cell wall biosynthesis